MYLMNLQIFPDWLGFTGPYGNGIGTDDSRANYTDLRAHWDHNIGYVIGFRKYEIFNK